MAKLIVGLGNIGKEYELTNHNMGFMTLDEVSSEYNLNFKKKMCDSLVCETNIKGNKVVFAKPTTYMNLSGIAVKSLVKKFNIDLKDVLIISDDIDLELSKCRLRVKGGAGGHNGLKSIIKELGSEDFARLKVGIGAPPEHMDLADYVLGRVRDMDLLKLGLDKAKQGVIMFAEGESFEQIMQKIN